MNKLEFTSQTEIEKIIVIQELFPGKDECVYKQNTGRGKLSFEGNAYFIDVEDDTFDQPLWHDRYHEVYTAVIHLKNYPKQTFDLTVLQNAHLTDFEVIEDEKYKGFMLFLRKENLEHELGNKNQSNRLKSKI